MQKKNYVAFDGDSDIKYYNLMKAWKQNDKIDSTSTMLTTSIQRLKQVQKKQSRYGYENVWKQ